MPLAWTRVTGAQDQNLLDGDFERGKAALAAGALGARMIGGGFGGSVLAMLPGDPGAAAPVLAAVTAAYTVRDWAPPVFYSAVPSAGARRVA